ncbi:MAG: Ig-like domain-containing protein [Eubacterium sp.]|nr:Ig-like domain-containing protein [Eubacterium sp.]
MMRRLTTTVLVMALALGLAAGLSSGEGLAKTKKISISKKKLTIYTGNKKQLKLKNVTKKQAKKITWKSSKKSVATVNKKGVITAKNEGKTTITATYKKKKYTCKVTVLTGGAGGDEQDASKNPYCFSEDDRVRCSFDDTFFEEAPTTFNHELAKCSLATAILSETKLVPEAEGGALTQLELTTRVFGFTDFDVNKDYKTTPTADSVGVACANKIIGDRTVVAVLIRSADYAAEWASNMTVGDGSDIQNHKGFELSRRKVSAYLSEYLAKYQIQGEVTFWLAGQSRGAAIANLTAAWLAEGEAVTGINTAPDKIYAYCFATPRAAYVSTGANKKDIKTGYGFIHNIVFDRDIVCRIPPEKLGFDIYGVRETNVIATDEEAVKEILKPLDIVTYNSLVSADEQDLQGMTRAQWVDKFVDDFTQMVVDRETYTREWQDTAIYMMSSFFGGEAPAGIVPDTQKMTGLAQIFLGGGTSLLVEHYPTVEYAYLAAAA